MVYSYPTIRSSCGADNGSASEDDRDSGFVVPLSLVGVSISSVGKSSQYVRHFSGAITSFTSKPPPKFRASDKANHKQYPRVAFLLPYFDTVVRSIKAISLSGRMCEAACSSIAR